MFDVPRPSLNYASLKSPATAQPRYIGDRFSYIRVSRFGKRTGAVATAEGRKCRARINRVYCEIDLAREELAGAGLMSDFLSTLQRFLAKIAITPSAIRGNAAGVNEAIIRFLSTLPLGDFADPQRFAETLDEKTTELCSCFSRPIPWGTGRKCLNIFLRDALYNHYIRNHYRLDGLEPLLEIPLDGQVEAGLRRDARRHPHLAPLPAWDTII